MTDALRAYADSVGAWVSGAEAVYSRLSAAVIAACPLRLDGAVVLDLGAGTGTAGAHAGACGARVVAVDFALEMLRHRSDARPPAAQADALALPLRDASVDVVIAACLINHFADPVAVVREAARVTRSGGAVVASCFPAGDPVKAALYRVVEDHGWEAPAWYLAAKEASDVALASVAALASVGEAAGLLDVDVVERSVSVAGMTIADLVGYRLGIAHIAPWLAARPPAERAAIRSEAADAVAPFVSTWVLELLVLTGRATTRDGTPRTG